MRVMLGLGGLVPIKLWLCVRFNRVGIAEDRTKQMITR